MTFGRPTLRGSPEGDALGKTAEMVLETALETPHSSVPRDLCRLRWWPSGTLLDRAAPSHRLLDVPVRTRPSSCSSSRLPHAACRSTLRSPSQTTSASGCRLVLAHFPSAFAPLDAGACTEVNARLRVCLSIDKHRKRGRDRTVPRAGYNRSRSCSLAPLSYPDEPDAALPSVGGSSPPGRPASLTCPTPPPKWTCRAATKANPGAARPPKWTTSLSPCGALGHRPVATSRLRPRAKKGARKSAASSDAAGLLHPAADREVRCVSAPGRTAHHRSGFEPGPLAFPHRENPSKNTPHAQPRCDLPVQPAAPLPFPPSPRVGTTAPNRFRLCASAPLDYDARLRGFAPLVCTERDPAVSSECHALSFLGFLPSTGCRTFQLAGAQRTRRWRSALPAPVQCTSASSSSRTSTSTGTDSSPAAPRFAERPLRHCRERHREG